MKKKSDAEFESDREDDLAEDDSEIEEDQGPDQEVIIADAVHQEDKITVSDPTAIAAIDEKSFFGTMTAQNTLELEILEALLLLERKRLRLYTEDQATMTFEDLLSITAGKDERIWTKYLIYRDLRQRGYVVRMGLGME